MHVCVLKWCNAANSSTNRSWTCDYFFKAADYLLSFRSQSHKAVCVCVSVYSRMPKAGQLHQPTSANQHRFVSVCWLYLLPPLLFVLLLLLLLLLSIIIHSKHTESIIATIKAIQCCRWCSLWTKFMHTVTLEMHTHTHNHSEWKHKYEYAYEQWAYSLYMDGLARTPIPSESKFFSNSINAENHNLWQYALVNYNGLTNESYLTIQIFFFSPYTCIDVEIQAIAAASQT